MDSAFLSSALVKVPSGAWFTITLSAVLAALFILWRFGKEQQWRAERQDRQPLSHYVKVEEQSRLRLATNSEGKGGEALSITKGLGIFFDKGGEKCPIIFSQFVSKLVSKPDVTIFFHLRPLESPTVPEDERYIVQKLDRLPNCFRVVARYGYMDEVVTPDLASLIYGRIRDCTYRPFGFGSDASFRDADMTQTQTSFANMLSKIASTQAQHQQRLPRTHHQSKTRSRHLETSRRGRLHCMLIPESQCRWTFSTSSKLTSIVSYTLSARKRCT